MPVFNRNISTKWRNEVPGARWFRSDLHIHTLDDHPSPNFTFPANVGNVPQDSSTQEAYARVFLQTAISNGIEVLGLTPHCVRSGESDDTSATWRIVEVWNNDNDDDGVPFRDKIYAVYPGFEPNMADGEEGLHLLFLFDPEIGRDKYIRAFNAIMGALTPWDGQELRISSNKASVAFDTLKDLHKREGENWDYLVLAPHAFSNRGLFSLKSEILRWFPHKNICGLELKDSWLPEDAHSDKPWLADGMKEHNHALYHSSDAYQLSNIGSRFTLIKLACPRIEALRQAFLASDSRMRIAYCKDQSNKIVISSDLPEPCPGSRPWLKEVSIKGGTSFFGGQNTSTGTPIKQAFQLNPDLNCLIGGRMSGKSTFIDGVRVMFGYDLPKDDVVRQDVQDRASKRFMSGNAEVSLQIHGPHNPASPAKERWPATFYAQRELQKAVRDQETRKQILYRLIPAETVGLLQRDEKLNQLDQGLLQLLEDVKTCRNTFEEAVQDFQHVEKSKEALERFKDAGIDELIEAQADQGRIEVIQEVLSKVDDTISTLESEADQISVNSITGNELKQALDGKDGEPNYQELFQKYKDKINDLREVNSDINKRLATAKVISESHMNKVRENVQKKVIKAGGKAEDINQFDALATSVADFEKVLTRLNKARKEYYKALRKFATTKKERFEVIRQQREAMQRVAKIVEKRFPDRIRVHIEENGLSDSLEQWISSLRESGITRWWNSQKATSPIPISPELIRLSFKRNILSVIGMSQPVATTFRGIMSFERKLQLVSMRNEDRYFIQLKVGAGQDDYRDIDELSGGAQVSVLLSMIFETDDTAPLIVDQPEDEMDKAYLFDVLLPALRRLKGRRQVIIATHDANIVVNGDADNVIFLEADFDQGLISEQGAIEEQGVKNAIIKTLDGGRDAFNLRQAKYGF